MFISQYLNYYHFGVKAMAKQCWVSKDQVKFYEVILCTLKVLAQLNTTFST